MGLYIQVRPLAVQQDQQDQQDQEDQQHRLHHLELTTGCCIKISTWRPLSTMSCAGPSFWAAACRRGWSVFVVFLMHPHIPHDKLPWAVHGCSILGWIFKLLLWIENLWAGWSKTGCYSHHVRHENARPTPTTRSLRVLITCFFLNVLIAIEITCEREPKLPEFRKRFGSVSEPECSQPGRASLCFRLLHAAADLAPPGPRWPLGVAAWFQPMVFKLSQLGKDDRVPHHLGIIHLSKISKNLKHS